MRYLFILCFLALPASAWAQSAVVVTNAPIYVAAQETQSPMRVAAVGTTLQVVADQGDWLQVMFNDPQFGRRYGWVKRTYVRVADPTTQPMDLSVPSPAAQPPLQPGQQMRPPQPHPLPFLKNHVVGRTGGTFGTAAAPLVGFELSGDVAPLCQAYGSFDWHFDVTPTSIKSLYDYVSAIYGVNFEEKVPGFAAIGGIKVIAPNHLAVRPYGVGGFGYGHGTAHIKVEGIDITDQLLDKQDIHYDKPLFEVGGGVAVPIGRLYIDGSYRFRKILNVDEPTNISGFYIGAGVSY